jgi:methionyl-tRNA formyltransferase
MIKRMNPNPSSFSCFLIGEGSLPIRCAEILLQHDHQILAVISADAELCQWAEQHKLPVYHPNDDLLSLMTPQPHDYLFSIVNRNLIPNEVLALPQHLAINYHDAPLPNYAGVHATSWAIMNREVKHGITWHVMTERVDAGDILKQHFVEIAPHDTALTLNAKCYEAAIAAFRELIDELAAAPDQITPVPQNLALRTYFGRHKRPPAGGVISWQQSAEEIDALRRALTFGPYPNALGLPKLAVGEALFIVVEVEAETKASTSPAGTIISVDLDRDWLTVATTTRDITIKKLLTVDGQALHLSELVEQYDLRPGRQLSHLDSELRQQWRAKSRQIGKHESFWRQRLASLQPLEVPYRKSVGAISESQEDQVLTVPISISHEVMAFVKARDWPPSHFVCAVFVLYLARLSDMTSFDLGFRPFIRSGNDEASRWDKQAVSDVAFQVCATSAQSGQRLDALFASQVPWRVEIELDWPFERLYQATEEEMALIRRHKTYARDVVVRYPELKTRLGLQQVPLSHVTIAEHLGQVKAVSDLMYWHRERMGTHRLPSRPFS